VLKKEKKVSKKFICSCCHQVGSLALVKKFATTNWYLCRHCMLLQKRPLPDDYQEDIVDNLRYRSWLDPIDDDFQSDVQLMGDVWEYYASRVQLPDHSKVLDFGSGLGSFMEQMKTRGIEAVGIEPSKKFAAFSQEKGHHVINGFLEPDAFPPNTFDVIHLRNVECFMKDHQTQFRLFHKILKPSGYIFYHGKQYNWNACFSNSAIREDSVHTCYLSRTSIHNICSLSGFEIVHFRGIFGGVHLIAKKGEIKPHLTGNFDYERCLLFLLPITDRIMPFFRLMAKGGYAFIGKFKKTFRMGSTAKKR